MFEYFFRATPRTQPLMNCWWGDDRPSGRLEARWQ